MFGLAVTVRIDVKRSLQAGVGRSAEAFALKKLPPERR
jgi:hypothetical protein